MNPITEEHGRYYFALHCPTPDCERWPLYLVEDVGQGRAPVEPLYGQAVRCPSCTKHIEIEARRIVTIAIR